MSSPSTVSLAALFASCSCNIAARTPPPIMLPTTSSTPCMELVEEKVPIIERLLSIAFLLTFCDFTLCLLARGASFSSRLIPPTRESSCSVTAPIDGELKEWVGGWGW